MRSPRSVEALEDLGRKHLSTTFFMLDTLYSEVASYCALCNVPDNPDLAIHVGRPFATHYADFSELRS